ncbi:MAG: hypothetical protein M0R23_10550, partial [Bacteroidales bacterium]|nr:hypothetical protein [Bacteroidales bacterium]
MKAYLYYTLRKIFFELRITSGISEVEFSRERSELAENSIWENSGAYEKHERSEKNFPFIP